MSVTITTPRTPKAEQAALEDLLQSEGWAIFHAAMSARWSAESYEADILKLMEDAEPGTDITPMVGQINATYKGMRQMLDWPREQIRALSRAPELKPRDPFAAFRRTMRSSA